MPGVVRIVRGENLPLRMGGLGFRRRLSGLESVGGDEDEGAVGQDGLGHFWASIFVFWLYLVLLSLSLSLSQGKVSSVFPVSVLLGFGSRWRKNFPSIFCF